MVIPYTVETFVIDLLLDQYKNDDPIFIQEKAREELETQLTVGQIKDYIERVDDLEELSYSISMKEIFDKI